MDLRVSAVLLLVFLTRGNSLKCYECSSAMGTCDLKETTCEAGSTKCLSQTTDGTTGAAKVSITDKKCVRECEPMTVQTPSGTQTTKCCDTDLCNAADGMYKVSFLLLLSPLLFYFLFH